ncbi:protein kinase domain-containing protein [Krasilnikovia sp. MM14-A1259]|uniref:protein kinase domain-containing protein n=1 Tax=Krasilnikovia sp. MM14-A1259 TaxID=3373539 RepID=UPI00382E2DB9
MAVRRTLVAGRYRLLEPVGSGGMGRVWVARDEMLDRDVAVKEFVPPVWMSDDEKGRLRTRTLREARSAARLNHPHVVRIYDVVHADGLPWIVMEYIESRSLFQAVRDDGPFPPAGAARIGLAVLDALTAAHRAGVLHRDVKPHNVLIGHDGRVVLTDFGLATFVDEGSVTGPGMIVGSPHYVSPERARDGASTVESDLWSLGATLYAAVEARSPYARESVMATLLALATEEPDPPVLAGPMTPVLLGLLRREPAERLTADEVAERLAAIVAVAEGRGPARERRRTMLGLMSVPMPRRPVRGMVAEPPRPDMAGRTEPARPNLAARTEVPARSDMAARFEVAARPDPGARSGRSGLMGRRRTPGGGRAGAVPTAGVERNASPAASAVPPRQRPGAPAGDTWRRNHPPRAAGIVRSAVPPAVSAPSLPAPRRERPWLRPAVGPPDPVAVVRRPAPAVATDPARPSAVPARPMPDASPPTPGPMVPAPSPPASPVAPGHAASRHPGSRFVLSGIAVLALLAGGGSPALNARLGEQDTEALPSVTTAGLPEPSSGQGGADGFSPMICGNPPGPDLPQTPQPGAGRGTDGWALLPGWSYYTDGSGFRLAVPDGWTYERVGTTTCFRDPASARYLSVDPNRDAATDPMQACLDEADQLTGAGQLPGYQQLELATVPMLSRAADWEFRYDGTPDVTMHAMIRWLTVGGRAYALGWATPDPDWTGDFDTYAAIRSTLALDPAAGQQ